MSGAVTEQFISGFCKSQNQTRTVLCEYEQMEAGCALISMDCFFEGCEHYAACVIAREARGIQELS